MSIYCQDRNECGAICLLYRDHNGNHQAYWMNALIQWGGDCANG